jgi:hypothetical protein
MNPTSSQKRSLPRPPSAGNLKLFQLYQDRFNKDCS